MDQQKVDHIYDVMNFLDIKSFIFVFLFWLAAGKLQEADIARL